MEFILYLYDSRIKDGRNVFSRNHFNFRDLLLARYQGIEVGWEGKHFVYSSYTSFNFRVMSFYCMIKTKIK